jgi:hypothetical protein
LLGLPVQRSKDISRAACRAQENAILQPSGTAGKTNDPSKLEFRRRRAAPSVAIARRDVFCRVRRPINLKSKRATSVSYMPMALTADLWSRGGRAVTLVTDAFAVRVNTDSQSIARSLTWRIGATGELFTEEAAVIVLSCGTAETPRLWLNSGLPNPNSWVGAGLTDHFVDLVVGVMPFYTGLTKGTGSGARIDYPGYGMIEVVGQPPGDCRSGIIQRCRDCRLLQQRLAGSTGSRHGRAIGRP